MLPSIIKETIIKEDGFYQNIPINDFVFPEYSASKHYLDLATRKYYHALLTLRHCFKSVSDYYFSIRKKAKNIDLFMLTPSISSPMGPGSNSEAIPLKFGDLDTFLVDSSQFGFEPILLNGFDKVYCYLPSMRGEDYNKRHLNQFFHCELEIKGKLDDIVLIIEDYVKVLCESILLMPNIIERLSLDPVVTRTKLLEITNINNFPRIAFDDAIVLLEKNGKNNLVNYLKSGRDISAEGEIELMRLLGINTPLWLTYFDRDRVPFYQKPVASKPDKVINADLLFPPLIKDSFGGEIVGCGQRQDNAAEILESLKRQNIEPDPYLWYIKLRNQPNYCISSGFGLGVERFLAWSLCRSDIKEVIIYPRLKNLLTIP